MSYEDSSIHADQIRPNNRAKDLEIKLQRIKNTRALPENIKKVLEFDAECEQNGRMIASRHSVLVSLHNLCRFAGKKPFKKFTKADIIEFLDAAKNRKFSDRGRKVNPTNIEGQLANSTMNLVRLRVKQFFQWLFDCEKSQYPESVRWIEIKTIRGEKELTPEELPTPREVRAMIESTENPRDRAMISLMAESGARIGEVSTIRLKDISFNDNGFILTIHRNRTKSKFGRRIPLCACAEDIKRWVNDYHPFKNDPEAPLFISFAVRTSPKANLKTGSIAGIIKMVAERTRVTKRIHMHPHKFRHFRASQLAELGWNEPMLRQYFGWSKTSNMPAVYIHMSQKSMNNRYYQMYGKASPQDSNQHNLKEPENCSKCGTRNPTGYRFCFRCNTLLEKDEQKLIENERQVKNTLNLIANNPQLAEKFTRLLQEAVLKERLRYSTSAPVPVQA